MTGSVLVNYIVMICMIILTLVSIGLLVAVFVVLRPEKKIIEEPPFFPEQKGPYVPREEDQPREDTAHPPNILPKYTNEKGLYDYRAYMLHVQQEKGMKKEEEGTSTKIERQLMEGKSDAD